MVPRSIVRPRERARRSDDDRSDAARGGEGGRAGETTDLDRGELPLEFARHPDDDGERALGRVARRARARTEPGANTI